MAELSTPVTPTQSPLSLPLTPMLRQYLDVKAQYQDSILFFRMGDFYEMFFDDAKRAAPLLDIALTTRDRKSENPVPMCGIPYHSADSYIATLIGHGLRVAICEQVEDAKLARGIVKREVIRVITPGTYIAENVSSSTAIVEPVYIAAVALGESGFGLSLVDLSTGEFRVTVMATLAEFLEEVFVQPVRELILPEEVSKTKNVEDFLAALQQRGSSIVIRYESLSLYHQAERMLCEHFAINSLVPLGLSESSAGVASPTMKLGLALGTAASGALLGYLKQTQRVALKHLDTLKLYHRDEAMVLDETTRLNLELFDSRLALQSNKRQRPNLYSVLNRCQTNMGERQLYEWISRPLTNLSAISARQLAVNNLYEEQELLLELRRYLQEIRDLKRLLARLVLGRCNPRDLLQLKDSLLQLPKLQILLNRCRAPLFLQMQQQWDNLTEVAMLIQLAIADEPPVHVADGGVIRVGYHAELDELRSLQHQGKSWLAKLEVDERQRTGIANLKVRFNNIFGYYIEVTRSNLKQVPADFERKQTLVNAERFITPKLKEYEEKVLHAAERILVLEQRLFSELLQQIGAQQQRISKMSELLAQLDVCQSLALVALEHRYVCPRLHEGRSLYIKAGRHPVVEQHQQQTRYVPNDITLDPQSQQLLILTGPNMAGKSTLLRQVALITLMAQIGSFVPADSAEIGIVDRIFTRIGAADDIAMGRSTFMVEMEETANILRYATDRSLLILDEIGRGTSTYDGLSIAWAIVEFLHESVKARTLFATHYHELIELGNSLPAAHNYHFSVREQGEKIIFMHHLLEGGVSRSYGIKVARLAGLPKSVIQRAEVVLKLLEAQRQLNTPEVSNQLPLFDKSSPEKNRSEESMPRLEKALKDLHVETLTPLEALNLLAQWKHEMLADDDQDPH